MISTLLAILAQITYPPCPPEGQHLSDTGKLLNETDAATVRSACEKLQREHGIPVVVATIPSMASCGRANTTIERFATQLFDYYGDIRSNWRKGILVVVAKEDRKARIECGDEWGSRFDRAASSIMTGTMVPQFRGGNYSSGIAAGVAAIAAQAPGVFRGSVAAPSAPSPWSPVARTRHDPFGHSYNSGWGSAGCGFGGMVLLVIVVIVLSVIRMITRMASPWSGGGLWRSPSYGYSPGGCSGGGYGYHRPRLWGGSPFRTGGGFFSSGRSGGGGRRSGGFSGGGGASGSW